MPVASARRHAAGLPLPVHFVTAEQVKNGKPEPDAYLTGAKLLGLKPEECVVVEDAPAASFPASPPLRGDRRQRARRYAAPGGDRVAAHYAHRAAHQQSARRHGHGANPKLIDLTPLSRGLFYHAAHSGRI